MLCFEGDYLDYAYGEDKQIISKICSGISFYVDWERRSGFHFQAQLLRVQRYLSWIRHNQMNQYSIINTITDRNNPSNPAMKESTQNQKLTPS
jgi:hypothetical protein